MIVAILFFNAIIIIILGATWGIAKDEAPLVQSPKRAGAGCLTPAPPDASGREGLHSEN